MGTDLYRKQPEDEELDGQEERETEEQRAPSAPVIHEVIRREGEQQLERSTAALAWSGLSAGLSMGFSLAAQGLLRTYLPDEPWRPLLTSFGYTLGFLIVMLGRQQLFTENSLTPILPLLSRRDGRTLLHVLRLWGTVLVANLLGALAFAWIAGQRALFDPSTRAAFTAIGQQALDGSAADHFQKAIIAGWLIALLVWIRGGIKGSGAALIVIITYVVALGHFSHSIAGSVDTLYVVLYSNAGWAEYFIHFLIPTALGNLLGGISLVALIHHAQVITRQRRHRIL